MNLPCVQDDSVVHDQVSCDETTQTKADQNDISGRIGVDDVLRQSLRPSGYRAIGATKSKSPVGTIAEIKSLLSGR